MDRRGFLKAIFATGCAPAFVKADSLMKLVIPSDEIYVGEGLILGAEKIVTHSNALNLSNLIAKDALKTLKNNLQFAYDLNREREIVFSNVGAITIRMPSRYYASSDFKSALTSAVRA